MILWTVAFQAPLFMGVFSERMLEWVAISFFRGSSQPRDQTCVFCVSCFAGGFFTTELWGKPFIEVYLIYNIVLVYDVQRSVLSLPIHTYTLTFHIYIYIYIYIHFYQYGLLQNIEYNFLCYTGNPCCLSVLYIVLCIWASLVAQR